MKHWLYPLQMKLAEHHILTGSEEGSESAQHIANPAQSCFSWHQMFSGKFALQFLFILFHTFQYV